MKLKLITTLALLVMSFIPAFAKEEPKDYWQEEGQRAKKSAPKLQGASGYVYAGLLGYFNFANDQDDENTAGLKISTSLRDVIPYFHFRLDGFVGIGGPAEGLLEVDFSLLRGLMFGVGYSHTKRLRSSYRLGLYVEDRENFDRRGGIFLLKNGSGGLEISWPIVNQWSVTGELGVEKRKSSDYTRILVGAYYRF